MKLISQGSLYSLLYAAYTYASYRFPAERINEYLVVNGVVPPNIRRDSQLSDVWRDYQQVLSELGFMYSTKVTAGIIEPTPCGLHLLDNESKFREILTGQVLLYQYPNGGKREYASEQIANGVLIRPAALVWRIINLISQQGSSGYLTSIEIRDFLMHCCKHSDSLSCANSIIDFRQTGHSISPNLLPNAGRNATDWITLLTNTLLFKSANIGNTKGIALSDYAINNSSEINELMLSLEDESSFWNPPLIDDFVRREWYSFYGALRIEVDLPIKDVEMDDIDVETNRDEQEVGFGTAGDVELRPFDSTRLNFNHENRLLHGRTIESSYDAGMVANRHRLHDTMVIYIAGICSQKGAEVLDDPKSIDLFVKYNATEYLIEVKTITARNYIKRLRYAVGQLFHYDFMLNRELPNRRKVLAFPSIIPSASGFLPFCNVHMGFDVLSLIPTSEGQMLHCDSNDVETQQLFKLA
jgi:hypothetical protein